LNPKKIKPHVAIICNSYPTAKNKTNQIFIKNLVDNLIQQSINPDVYYNLIFNIWGNANVKKDFISNMIKYSVFLINIFRLLCRIKSYNILNPHGVMLSGFFATLLKRLFKIPVVLHIHGGDLNLFKSSTALYRKIYKSTIYNSDFIIVNSLNIKNELLALIKTNSKKVEVISPGINYDKFYSLDYNQINNFKNSYKIDKEKIILLFAGNAIKRKGLDIFINALKKLNIEYLNKIYIIVCSDGPEIIKLKNDIKNIYGLKDSFKYLKKVEQNELNILYNIATLFIFPSREEPLGLVGLEAIATGTPVIGSNIGGIREYINKSNGYLFNPNSPKELSEIIATLIDKPQLIELLTKNIVKRYREHDINISTKKIIEIFTNIKKS